MKRDVALFAFLLSLACPFAAQAGTMMETSGKVFAPPAFYSFCSRQPGLCSTAGEKKVVTLRPGLSAQLNQVNRSVNSRITELSDQATVGKDDEWRVPTVSGDCEDIAILKKLELMKRGWPPSALLLTVASRHGEGHGADGAHQRRRSGARQSHELRSRLGQHALQLFRSTGAGEWQALGADRGRQAGRDDRDWQLTRVFLAAVDRFYSCPRFWLMRSSRSRSVRSRSSRRRTSL